MVHYTGAEASLTASRWPRVAPSRLPNKLPRSILRDLLFPIRKDKALATYRPLASIGRQRRLLLSNLLVLVPTW